MGNASKVKIIISLIFVTLTIIFSVTKNDYIIEAKLNYTVLQTAPWKCNFSVNESWKYDNLKQLFTLAESIFNYQNNMLLKF